MFPSESSCKVVAVSPWDCNPEESCMAMEMLETETQTEINHKNLFPTHSTMAKFLNLIVFPNQNKFCYTVSVIRLEILVLSVPWCKFLVLNTFDFKYFTFLPIYA